MSTDFPTRVWNFLSGALQTISSRHVAQFTGMISVCIRLDHSVTFQQTGLSNKSLSMRTQQMAMTGHLRAGQGSWTHWISPSGSGRTLDICQDGVLTCCHSTAGLYSR